MWHEDGQDAPEDCLAMAETAVIHQELEMGLNPDYEIHLCRKIQKVYIIQRRHVQ